MAWSRGPRQLFRRRTPEQRGRIEQIEALARANMLRRAAQPPGIRRSLRQALRLVVFLALLVAAGTALLMLPISGATRALAWNEALFTAVSALATTGLSIITPGQDLSMFGQIVLLLLMELGGLGFITGAVVLFRLLGHNLTLEERLSLRDSMGLIAARSVLQLARRVAVIALSIQAVGATVLWLLWLPLFGPLQAAYYAVFHAVSAFTNASFDLFSRSPDAPARFPDDAASLLVIATLIVCGSIGIPVLNDLLHWRNSRRLALHTRLTIVTVGALLLLGTIGVFLGESKPGVLFADLPWPRRLLLALFHSASSRTSGFVLSPLEAMDGSSVLLLTVLMFIGGSPASMGGGVTTSTLAVLVLAMWHYVRGQEQIVISGRRIAFRTVQKALTILVISLVFVMVVSWLLLLTQKTTLDAAVFETVSAFATCGFTLGLTTKLDLFGQILIAMTMFCGRLGVLTVVAVLAKRAESHPVFYPEEPILIG